MSVKDFLSKRMIPNFVFQTGTTFGPYGGGGGGAFSVSYPNCKLHYFSGRYGTKVDGLTFHFICYS